MAEHDLANNFASTLTELSGELTSSDIMRLTFLYPKINKNEADKIQKDENHAHRFFRNLLEDPKELHSTNVDGLIKKLKEIQLIKAAGILKLYKSRNANLINKEIERQEQEKQLVASSPPSSPVKSPPSQKGDGTDVKYKIFISVSSKIIKLATDLVETIESELGKGICWIYTEEIKPGESLNQSIIDAIDKADIMVCMINQDYIDSIPCVKEFLLAKDSGKQIILLHMEKISQPYKKKNGGNSSMQLDVTDKVYARMYENREEELQKVIAKIKECLPGKDANASGSPSTSGSQKRRCSQDGDASEVKVTRKE